MLVSQSIQRDKSKLLAFKNHMQKEKLLTEGGDYTSKQLASPRTKPKFDKNQSKKAIPVYQLPQCSYSNKYTNCKISIKQNFVYQTPKTNKLVKSSSTPCDYKAENTVKVVQECHDIKKELKKLKGVFKPFNTINKQQALFIGNYLKLALTKNGSEAFPKNSIVQVIKDCFKAEIRGDDEEVQIDNFFNGVYTRLSELTALKPRNNKGGQRLRGISTKAEEGKGNNMSKAFMNLMLKTTKQKTKPFQVQRLMTEQNENSAKRVKLNKRPHSQRTLPSTVTDNDSKGDITDLHENYYRRSLATESNKRQVEHILVDSRQSKGPAINLNLGVFNRLKTSSKSKCHTKETTEFKITKNVSSSFTRKQSGSRLRSKKESLHAFLQTRMVTDHFESIKTHEDKEDIKIDIKNFFQLKKQVADDSSFFEEFTFRKENSIQRRERTEMSPKKSHITSERNLVFKPESGMIQSNYFQPVVVDNITSIADDTIGDSLVRDRSKNRVTSIEIDKILKLKKNNQPPIAFKKYIENVTSLKDRKIKPKEPVYEVNVSIDGQTDKLVVYDESQIDEVIDEYASRHGLNSAMRKRLYEDMHMRIMKHRIMANRVNTDFK